MKEHLILAMLQFADRVRLEIIEPWSSSAATLDQLDQCLLRLFRAASTMERRHP
jgi:hypothetical protein